MEEDTPPAAGAAAAAAAAAAAPSSSSTAADHSSGDANGAVKAFYEVQNPHCRHLNELSASFPVILQELRNVLTKKLFDPWPEANLYKTSAKTGGSWNVFGLYSFGKK